MGTKISNLIIKVTDTAKELFIIYIVIILTAAGLYSLFEHKAFFDAIWWAVVTAMTVGYGDSYPLTVTGKIIAMALMHVVPLFVIPLITARLTAKLTVDSNAFTNTEQEYIKTTLRRIEKKLNK